MIVLVPAAAPTAHLKHGEKCGDYRRSACLPGEVQEAELVHTAMDMLSGDAAGTMVLCTIGRLGKNKDKAEETREREGQQQQQQQQRAATAAAASQQEEAPPISEVNVRQSLLLW